jgi:hypothetical protein
MTMAASDPTTPTSPTTPAAPLRRPSVGYGNTPSTLGSRLRTYLIGVGIGVSLLGMLWMMKRQAALQQAARPAEAAPGGSGTAPPTPTSGN